MSSYQFAHRPIAALDTSLREEWQRLVEAMPNAVPFQAPAWVEAYAREWPQRGAASLQVVTARRGGRLVALMPLALRTRRIGPLSLRFADALCNPHMPLCDITVDPAEAAVVPALFDWVLGKSRLGIARLDFPGIADDAALGGWLTQLDARRHRTTRTSEAARIDTRMDYDSLIKAVSSKHRSNLSRSTKRAEAIGPLRYEVYTGEAMLAQGWPLLLEIEASGWKGRAGTAIGNDAGLQRFYRAAAEGLGASGHCSISVLWFGDRPAAAGLLLAGGRAVYGHKIGYREEWAAMGPGHLLVREIVQRACNDPAIDAVSLVLHPPWSDVWRPSLTPVTHHSLFGRGLVAAALWQATQLKARRAAAASAAASPAADAPQASPAKNEGPHAAG